MRRLQAVGLAIGWLALCGYSSGETDMASIYDFKADQPEVWGAISWNFNKFLIGRDGAIVGRFGSRTKPADKDPVSAVEKALQRP